MSAQAVPGDWEPPRTHAGAVRDAVRARTIGLPEGLAELPERPSGAALPDIGAWAARGSCRTADVATLDAMTSATSQEAASELAADYCQVCPVAPQCLAAGRQGHEYGLWGGLVLDEGWVAVIKPQKERAPRRLRALSAPPEPKATTPGGQRWQPRRLTRSRRRTGHHGRVKSVSVVYDGDPSGLFG